jgi:methylmalonyl-CoA mutase N-terminal domain/subunit
VARVTIQALAAVLGGTQSLHTNGMDEALQLPTASAARTALRTQQIIGYESGVTDTVDPLAGSYVIESLTDEIEKRAFELIGQIDAMGGAVIAIEKGWMQSQIAEASYQYQRKVENNDEVIVGVNEFVSKDEGVSAPRFMVNPAVEQEQRQRLAQWRAQRDNARAHELIAQLECAARENENLLPRLIACIEGHVTVGEIGKALTRVFGEYRPATMF